MPGAVSTTPLGRRRTHRLVVSQRRAPSHTAGAYRAVIPTRAQVSCPPREVGLIEVYVATASPFIHVGVGLFSQCQRGYLSTYCWLYRRSLWYRHCGRGIPPLPHLTGIPQYRILRNDHDPCDRVPTQIAFSNYLCFPCPTANFPCAILRNL